MTTPTPMTFDDFFDATFASQYPQSGVPDGIREVALVTWEARERDLAAAQEELRHYRAGRVEMQAQINEAEQKAFQAENSAAAAQEWREAVLNELIVAHIYTKEHDNNPRKAIHDAIDWNCKVALDPAVSSDARKLIATAQEARQAAEDRAKHLDEGWNKSLDVAAKYLERAQAAEALAESYRKDAEKWRLMFGSARVSAVGCAGLHGKSEGDYAHLCLNFWTMHEPATGVDPLAQEWIDGYLAKARAAIAGEPK